MTTEYPARLEFRPFHEADMDEDCGICRMVNGSQWVLVFIGWHEVAKIAACSGCSVRIKQAHAETTHTPKPAHVGAAS